MFTLKVTKQDGSIEQSDFKTNEEALAWKAHLAEIGYNFNSSIIQHPEIPAIEARAAILDENGFEISPEVIGVDAVLAWAEIIPAPYRYEIIETKEVLADISPRQIRLALLSLGLTESLVDTAINNFESPTKEQAMIAWKHSTSFQRTVPTVEAIGSVLGLSSEQLDSLWVLGAGL